MSRARDKSFLSLSLSFTRLALLSLSRSLLILSLCAPCCWYRRIDKTTMGQSSARSDAILFFFLSVFFVSFFVAVFGCGFVALYRMPPAYSLLLLLASCDNPQTKIYIRHANTCTPTCTQLSIYHLHILVYTMYTYVCSYCRFYRTYRRPYKFVGGHKNRSAAQSPASSHPITNNNRPGPIDKLWNSF